MLIAQPRSGTQALGSVLDGHPQIRFRDEVFHEDNPDTWFRFLTKRVEADPEGFWPRRARENFTAFLRYLESSDAKPVQVIDVKYTSLHQIVDSWKGPSERPAILTFAREERLPILHLTRRNHLKAYVSLRLAQRNDVWHLRSARQLAHATIELPGPHALAVLERYAVEHEMVSAYLDGHEPLLALEYEELFGSDGSLTPEVQARIGTLLGVSPFESVKPAYVKQTSDDLSRVISGFDELAQALASTPYAWMLRG
jgi:hypothetical protein